MAVQAHSQYTSPAMMVRTTNVFENLKHQDDPFASFAYQGMQQPVFNRTVLSEPETESEVTYNNNNNMMFGSRKRNKVGQPNEFQFPKAQTRLLNSSQTASTSGRSCSGDSPFDFNPHLLQQNLEIDALIHFQNEKLRSGLKEMHNRHRRSTMSLMEQQVLKRLEEKKNELANASHRNTELEERVKQMSAENQIWFSVAKKNEAIVSTLRLSLQQLLLQIETQGQLREGFGDGNSVVDDAKSCSSASVAIQKTQENNCCKVCQENEVSVLVLPCRHLCLCKSCDSKIDLCPVCNSVKNASLQVLIS